MVQGRRRCQLGHHLGRCWVDRALRVSGVSVRFATRPAAVAAIPRVRLDASSTRSARHRCIRTGSTRMTTEVWDHCCRKAPHHPSPCFWCVEAKWGSHPLNTTCPSTARLDLDVFIAATITCWQQVGSSTCVCNTVNMAWEATQARLSANTIVQPSTISQPASPPDPP